MDLDALEDGRAGLTVTFRGLTANVVYYPLRVGLNLQRGLAEAAVPPYPPGQLLEELPKVLVEWDVRRKGELVPITPDGVGTLPLGLSSAVARAIMEDFGDPKSPVATPPPDSPSPTPSPATSSTAGEWATAPSSPSPSSTPAGPASPSGTTSDSQTPVAT